MVERSSAAAGLSSSRSIIRLAAEVGRRHASKGVDRIAALSYLLHFEELPLYSHDEDVEQGWMRCLKSAPATLLAELFFNSSSTGLWNLFPTWQELRDCPAALVKQGIPSASSVLRMEELRVHRRLGIFGRGIPISMRLEFSGYHLRAYIRNLKTTQDANSCLVVAQPNLKPRFPGMLVNLRFFAPHVEGPTVNWLHVVDSWTAYDLFTHSLEPCSSWVVMHGGKKVGALCCDEHFGGMHRSQILKKGSLVNQPIAGSYQGRGLSSDNFELVFIPRDSQDKGAKF